jgi:CheY-like chemotaxis protein
MIGSVAGCEPLRTLNAFFELRPLISSGSSGPDFGSPRGAESAAVRSNELGQPKLLIVEDNPTDVMLVREAIRAYGIEIEVHVVHDGQEALEFLEGANTGGTPVTPDIILLDLNLPKRSGVEVLQRLRQTGQCANTSIIVFTSSDAAKDRTAVAQLGVTRYFRKPNDYEEFLRIGELLKQVCGERRLQ